ncbi:hypothetical protein C8R47DRAFT_731636 [Mycena vitilis]|nr:hypothetical protein C8R47DRAFT_731636 [Mycena vitilis]
MGCWLKKYSSIRFALRARRFEAQLRTLTPTIVSRHERKSRIRGRSLCVAATRLENEKDGGGAVEVPPNLPPKTFANETIEISSDGDDEPVASRNPLTYKLQVKIRELEKVGKVIPPATRYSSCVLGNARIKAENKEKEKARLPNESDELKKQQAVVNFAQSSVSAQTLRTKFCFSPESHESPGRRFVTPFVKRTSRVGFPWPSNKTECCHVRNAANMSTLNPSKTLLSGI